jgi:hypothetical protein
VASDSYKRQARHLVAETEAHITHCGWDSQFCGGFSIRMHANVGVFHNNNNDSFILTCSDIVHDGYENTHH